MNSQDVKQDGHGNNVVVENNGPPPVPVAKLAPIPSPSGTSEVVAVHEDYRIERLNGPKRLVNRHRFDDLYGFCDWIGKYFSADVAQVFVGLVVDDHKGGLVGLEAIEDAALADCDRVSGDMPLDPLFQRWLALFSAGWVDQRTLYEHLVTARESFPRGDQITSAERITEAVRSISWEKGKEIKAELEPSGLYKVSGAQSRTDVKGQIPSEFDIVVPVIDGLLDAFEDAPDVQGEVRTYGFHCFLRLQVSEEKGLLFMLTCPELDGVLREVRKDVAKYLQAGLALRALHHWGEPVMSDADGFLVTLGSPSTTEALVKVSVARRAGYAQGFQDGLATRDIEIEIDDPNDEDSDQPGAVTSEVEFDPEPGDPEGQGQ